MNFKDSLKRNDYNTLSILIFSIQTLIFYFIFLRDREGERERERREKRAEREKREEGERGGKERRERVRERREKREGIRKR